MGGEPVGPVAGAAARAEVPGSALGIVRRVEVVFQPDMRAWPPLATTDSPGGHRDVHHSVVLRLKSDKMVSDLRAEGDQEQLAWTKALLR